MIGFRFVLPQFQELINIFQVIMMEDSSYLVADEQFLRGKPGLLCGKPCEKTILRG
jgi:hypothetical protein